MRREQPANNERSAFHETIQETDEDLGNEGDFWELEDYMSNEEDITDDEH